VEKFVSSDGTTWADADVAPGPQLVVGSNVWFRFVVTNTGTAALANVALSDSTLDLSSCAIPTTLDVGASAECVIGPLLAVQGQHTNTATVTANLNGTPVNDTDTANYMGGQTTLPVTIIVEGPVQVINVNVITIYDIDITINANDPVLTNIQVGDFVRVEGDAFEDLDVLVVVAVTVFVVDVDVIWTNNNVIVWQASSDCGNAPPPWAPAWGWRARCQTPIIIISGGGMGMGMGDDD
jgi:uncharacterized repeat protein (TIGR01451 family)